MPTNQSVELQLGEGDVILLDAFLALCEHMAGEAGITMKVTDTKILFSGTIEDVDLRYSISDGFVSIRSREYCPGYDGSPDGRIFIVETITDHIEIAQGKPRQEPDWREIFDGMEAPVD